MYLAVSSTESTEDVDRKIYQIRRGLEAERNGTDFDFHDQDIRDNWEPESMAWADFVKLAKAYLATGRLDEEELDYKLDTGQKLADARQSVLSSSDDWAAKTKSGISGSNLIYSIELAKFRDWIDGYSDDALQAMQAIWAGDDTPIDERLRGFGGMLPLETSRGPGVRTNLMAVLLMGIDAKEYPPFRVGYFKDAYNLTQYEKPSEDADEAARYLHALAFLDRFIEEAGERGLPIENRLEAQSLVWGVLQKRGKTKEVEEPSEDPPTPQRDLNALAIEVFLPVNFLKGNRNAAYGEEASHTPRTAGDGQDVCGAEAGGGTGGFEGPGYSGPVPSFVCV